MIGEIIKEQRKLIKMSRKTLAEGICTEKYVYLIEKNKRNPSAYILDLFSERLGIDLFEYYQYLGFENKSSVVKHKKNFERYIKLGDIEKLKEEGLKAAQLEDFKSKPLYYDIVIIDLIHKALVEGKTSESIEKLSHIVESKKLNIDTLTLINAYVVLSTCYQLEGQLDRAREIVEIAYEMIRNKTDFSRYNTVIINVLISLTSYLYSAGEYKELIKYANELIEFQEKNTEYNRMYYGDFYLAFAYYRTNKLSESKEHYMRGIHSVSLFQNKRDLNTIIKMEAFNDLAEKLGIDQVYIERLSKLAE